MWYIDKRLSNWNFITCIQCTGNRSNLWFFIHFYYSQIMRTFSRSFYSSLKHICHLFMYSRKLSPWDCVIKLRDNRIFKVLLWIKKSFKSIDSDLAKHALVSPPTHPCSGWVNLDCSGSYEIIIDVFTVVIMYSYLFDLQRHSTLQLI